MQFLQEEFIALAIEQLANDTLPKNHVFNMSTFGSHAVPCGTVACLAGTAHYLQTGELPSGCPPHLVDTIRKAWIHDLFWRTRYDNDEVIRRYREIQAMPDGPLTEEWIAEHASAIDLGSAIVQTED